MHLIDFENAEHYSDLKVEEEIDSLRNELAKPPEGGRYDFSETF